MNLSNIPEHMHEGIINYVEHGIHPGSFLYAVFGNSLVDAASQADDINKYHLLAYAALIYNGLPWDCWGSYDVVEKWISHGGLDGAKR